MDCDQRAWHAGLSSYRGRNNCNDDSIGIELEGLEGFSFAAAASVPEPLAWVQMLFGFGLTGGMLRRLYALRGVSA